MGDAMNNPPEASVGLRETEVFWGEISPNEHLVQFYPDQDIFLDTLEGYVVGGILAGDSVVIIATPANTTALVERLMSRGIDVEGATARNQFMTFDAQETLSKFMFNGWPDEVSFASVISTILLQAKAGGRRVRAFGEMVALLWAQGNSGATVKLEHLWHNLCHDKSFSLFCAYPKAGFTQEAAASIKEICDAHSRVVY